MTAPVVKALIQLDFKIESSYVNLYYQLSFLKKPVKSFFVASKNAVDKQI